MDIAVLSYDDRRSLGQSVLCKFMPENILERFISSGFVRNVSKSEYLFEQGTPGKDLYILLDGWAQLVRRATDGSDTQIAVFHAGDGIAEIAAILEKPYPASAQAMTDLRVFSVEGAHLIDLLHDDREALSAILSSLFSKLHELVDSVEVLKAYTIKQRLALFMLRQSDGAEAPFEFDLPFDKGFIASQIGTSPEQLSRTFRQLREHGVHLIGKRAKVDDPAALRRVLAGN